MDRRIFGMLFAAMFCVAEPTASAEFKDWKSFKGTTIFRDEASKAYCYSTTNAVVDADGAPNAYHPGDVGKNCYKDAHLGLDCPENAGYPGTDWWTDVLVTDPVDQSIPYIQKTGPYKGFFVAMTWLQDQNAAVPVTDPAKYVDSTKVPYVVFPGSQFAKLAGTGTRGDIGLVYNLSTKKSTAFVVADQGGGSDARLGEASIALFEALGGKNVNARTGDGIAPGKLVYLIFPGSHRGFPWPQTIGAMRTEAARLLSGIGGESALAQCQK